MSSDGERRAAGLSRRALLQAVALGAAASAVVTPVRAQMAIRPRDAWGSDLPPTGPLEAEQQGDTRFLLVHHSASANDYQPGDVPNLLRSFYATHTSSRGWPDLAYNFMVDRFGTVWEGRAGSLQEPIKGDATGGSQGFAQLACFIGNLEIAPPTPEAESAMVQLLAALAIRYGIDPQATTSFVSRGSNRFPAGTPVTTPTIAGHRDMSETVCPGRFGYELVGRLPVLVATQVQTMVADGTAAAPQGQSAPSDQPSATAAAAEGAQSVQPAASTSPPAVPAAPPGAPSAPAVPPPTTRPLEIAGADKLAVASTRPLTLTAAGLLTVVGAAAAAVVSRRGLR